MKKYHIERSTIYDPHLISRYRPLRVQNHHHKYMVVNSKELSVQDIHHNQGVSVSGDSDDMAWCRSVNYSSLRNI